MADVDARHHRWGVSPADLSGAHDVGMDAVCELSNREGYNLGSLTPEDDCETLHEVFDIRPYADL